MEFLMSFQNDVLFNYQRYVDGCKVADTLIEDIGMTMVTFDDLLLFSNTHHVNPICFEVILSGMNEQYLKLKNEQLRISQLFYVLVKKIGEFQVKMANKVYFGELSSNLEMINKNQNSRGILQQFIYFSELMSGQQ